MLRANGIAPQNPEPREPKEHAPTSETSSGKGKHFKVEKEVESGCEDEDSMREKALLVCFRFLVVNYLQFIIDISRPSLIESGREGT